MASVNFSYLWDERLGEIGLSFPNLCVSRLASLKCAKRQVLRMCKPARDVSEKEEFLTLSKKKLRTEDRQLKT